MYCSHEWSSYRFWLKHARVTNLNLATINCEWKYKGEINSLFKEEFLWNVQNHLLAIWWNFCAWLSSEMAIVGSNTNHLNWDFVGLPKSTCSSPSYLVRCNNWLAHAFAIFRHRRCLGTRDHYLRWGPTRFHPHEKVASNGPGPTSLMDRSPEGPN